MEVAEVLTDRGGMCITVKNICKKNKNFVCRKGKKKKFKCACGI
jgi:hypothetical protein